MSNSVYLMCCAFYTNADLPWGKFHTASNLAGKICLFVLRRMSFQTQPGLEPTNLGEQDCGTDHQATIPNKQHKQMLMLFADIRCIKTVFFCKAFFRDLELKVKG